MTRPCVAVAAARGVERAGGDPDELGTITVTDGIAMDRGHALLAAEPGRHR